MLHRHIVSITLASTLLAAGCGEDHKTTDTTTHGDTHLGGTTSEDTAPTTGEATSGATDESTGATSAAIEPPAAPTDLTATILEGGVHVTWKDVADNEDNYILENKADGEAEFSVVIEMPFDSVTYHDIDVTAGTGYTYRVKAANAGGESVSNEVMVQVP
ncbi:MAG TPA: fibronectin type III domain-containing protein [Nannocystis sp.]|jgi:hypothetical protein